MDVPWMIIASGSMVFATTDITPSTSPMLKFSEPRTATSSLVAPSIRVSSKSGLLIAAVAASTARFSPSPSPTPISAYPCPSMVFFTSMKSKFTSPGRVIKSEILCTDLRSRSSATRYVSLIGQRLSTTLSKF